MSRVVDCRSRPITLDCTGIELLRLGAADRLATAKPDDERLWDSESAGALGAALRPGLAKDRWEDAPRVVEVDAGFRTVGAPVERVVSETPRLEAGPLDVLARGAALLPDPLERADAVDSDDLRGDEALARWLLGAADLPEVNPRLKPVPPAGVEANFSDLGVAARARTPCPSGVSGR